MEEQILIHIYIDVEIIFPRYLEPFTQMFTNCYKCFAIESNVYFSIFVEKLFVVNHHTQWKWENDIDYLKK